MERQRLQDIEEFRLKELERKRLRFEAAQAKATNSAETAKGKFHIHFKLSAYSAYAEHTDTQFKMLNIRLVLWPILGPGL